MANKYDIKKTLWKIVKSAIYVFIAGLAVIYGDNPYYIALAPLLSGLENYLKHGTRIFNKDKA